MPDRRRLRGRSRPRLTSVGVLGFGGGWEWPESERAVVRELIAFLEDRRALSAPEALEIESHVVQSILRIREELTRTLQRLSAESGAAASVRALRDACHAFLYAIHGRDHYSGFDYRFLIDLGQLRGVFAVYVGELATRYGIVVNEPLATVLHAASPALTAPDDDGPLKLEPGDDLPE